MHTAIGQVLADMSLMLSINMFYKMPLSIMLQMTKPPSQIFSILCFGIPLPPTKETLTSEFGTWPKISYPSRKDHHNIASQGVEKIPDVIEKTGDHIHCHVFQYGTSKKEHTRPCWKNATKLASIILKKKFHQIVRMILE